MAAYWQRRDALDVTLHTTLLPSSNGDLVMLWLEDTLSEDAELAALNPITLQWIQSIPTEKKDDKVQNWKLAGCAKAPMLGSFVFALDEIERLGRWRDVEGQGKPRLEHRIATGHLPSSRQCGDLRRAAELLASFVYSSVLRASKSQNPTSSRSPDRGSDLRGSEL